MRAKHADEVKQRDLRRASLVRASKFVESKAVKVVERTALHSTCAALPEHRGTASVTQELAKHNATGILDESIERDRVVQPELRRRFSHLGGKEDDDRNGHRQQALLRVLSGGARQILDGGQDSALERTISCHVHLANGNHATAEEAIPPKDVALPGNTWAGEGDPGCVRTALNRTPAQAAGTAVQAAPKQK